jgi:hypothetical protein
MRLHIVVQWAGDPKDARRDMIQKGLAPALIVLNAE